MSRRARLLLVLGLSSFVVACSAAAGGGFSNGDGSGDDDAGTHHSSGGGTDKDGGAATTLPDGAVVLPDGAIVDPDSGVVINPVGDGSAPTSRIACGGTYCRGDQSCNAGSCQYACTGTQVPGDYATIQAALTALVGTTDAKICLKAQSYPETVSFSSSSTTNTPKSVEIVGVSSSSTTINALNISGNPFSHVVVRGVAFTSTVSFTANPEKIELYGVRLGNASTTSYALQVDSNADLLLDGCEVTASPSYYGIYLSRSTSAYGAVTTSLAPKVTIRNSWIHDAQYGVYTSTSSYSGSQPTLNVSLVNNTFSGNNYGISTTGGSYIPMNLTYVNNVIVNSKTYGVSLSAAQTTVTAKNNALWNNVNNYAGSATDGAGYVKADLKLDSSQSPPALGAGSPARGAADATMAPEVDFWDVTRPSTPDIGAVQN
ncbi:MAG: right-handed parallel beta-helix repeat-containing protein [Polyangiaceae bacterium]